MIGFGNDSMVNTLDESVLISNIVDDIIEFYNVETQEDSFQPIIDVTENLVSDVVSFNTSMHNEFVSGMHSLFYVKNKFKFVKACELEFGDKLICPTGDSIQWITHIELKKLNNTTLYSLNHMLDDSFGYFIHDVLVKNK